MEAYRFNRQHDNVECVPEVLEVGTTPFDYLNRLLDEVIDNECDKDACIVSVFGLKTLCNTTFADENEVIVVGNVTNEFDGAE